MHYLIAIDPGKKGAMAVFNIATEQPLLVESFPLKDGDIDYAKLNELVRPYAGKAIAVLEKVHAWGMGVTSALHYGMNSGAWMATLAASNIPFETVEAREWKKALGLDSDKAKSLETARTLYPSMVSFLKRKKDHDRAEALLIGHWYFRHKL